MRTRLILPRIACGGALLCATAAVAQYQSDDAPRPPGSVPGRPAPSQYPPPQYPPPQYPPPQYAQPQYAPPGQWQGTPPSAAAPVRPGAIQSEELPAPGAPAAVQPAAMPPPGQSPAPYRQQQRPAAAPPAAPADVVTPPPQQRISNPTAVFNGLDKITGRITSFDSAIGETVQFGALQVTARACYSRPPTETPLTDGFIEVDEVTLQGDVRRIFTGWMFAASPGLHAVEHAVYDIWLVDCKGGGAQAAAEPQPATPAAASPPRQQQPPRQGNSQQRSPQQRQPAPPQSGTPR
jgi:hypothetical protein